MEKLIALKHKLDAIKAMGTNAKKEALASMDDFEQRMVSLMLNPFVRFGVKKYNVADPLSKSVPSDEKAIELLEKLAAGAYGKRSHHCGRVFGRFDVCRRSGRISPVPAERPESRRRHKSLQ